MSCSVQDCKDPGPYVRSGIAIPGLRECILIDICMWHAPFLAAWQSMGDPIPGVDRRPEAAQRRGRRKPDLAGALDTLKREGAL